MGGLGDSLAHLQFCGLQIFGFKDIGFVRIRIWGPKRSKPFQRASTRRKPLNTPRMPGSPIRPSIVPHK